MNNLPRLPDLVDGRTFLSENPTKKPTFRLRYVTATPRETAQNLRFQTKKCISCKNTVNEQDSCYLIWEDRCFCDMLCLKLYQKQELKENCAQCFKTIPEDLVGRLVFRYDLLLQFCSILCFQRFQSKKKFCLYCMGKVSSLSHRVSHHNPKFCSQDCGTKHLIATRPTHVPLQPQTACFVCKSSLQPIMIQYQIENEVKNICNQFCLQTLVISNQVKPVQCVSCKIYFTSTSTSIKMIHEDASYMFCSKKCETYYVFKSQLIYPCDYCKTARVDTDLIKRYSRLEPPTYLCSIDCYLKKYSPKEQHLPVPAQPYTLMPSQQSSLAPQRLKRGTFRLPLITRTPLSTIVENVQEPLLNSIKLNDNIAHMEKEEETNDPLLVENTPTFTENSSAQIKTCFIVKPECSPGQKNVATMCSIPKVDKSICIKPQGTDQWVQTDVQSRNTILIPVPVPIYVATPVHMFSIPVPSPVPFPLPIPVPVFIPVTRKSYKRIFEDTEKIISKIPSDPMQADILKIAEALSSDANKDSEEDLALSEQAINEMFSDDLLESAFNTYNEGNVVSITVDNNSTSLNEGTCSTITLDSSTSISKPTSPKQEQKNYLETSLGLHAWRQWIKKTKSVVLANSESTNLLELSPSELGSGLVLFIAEVKRPNGKNYAPDTIFYLCLSIQKYLLENNRLDNIFFDSCYKEFVETLDYHMRAYPVLFLDSAYIVTRVEEEHLWESKQLGAHSPFILLNTILYHNMKYFNLMSIEENMSLSFSSVVRKEHKQDTSKMIFRLDKGQGHYHDMLQKLDNRERCPVKLFEFYLLKVPIDRRQNNHSCYLQPDSRCTGISPTWYSIEPLARDDLEIMINRLKVVKELNIPIEI